MGEAIITQSVDCDGKGLETNIRIDGSQQREQTMVN